MVRKDWLKWFWRLRPELAKWKHESTSLASFNRATVQKFFNNVETVQFEDNNACIIYNSDGTALTTVHNAVNVLAPKGLRQVGQVTSRERGCFVNASGNTISPFMVFLRVNFKSPMLFGALPDLTSVHQSGRINSFHKTFISIPKTHTIQQQQSGYII